MLQFFFVRLIHQIDLLKPIRVSPISLHRRSIRIPHMRIGNFPSDHPLLFLRKRAAGMEKFGLETGGDLLDKMRGRRSIRCDNRRNPNRRNDPNDPLVIRFLFYTRTNKISRKVEKRISCFYSRIDPCDNID